MIETAIFLTLIFIITVAAIVMLRGRTQREQKGQAQLRLALAEGQTVPLSLHPVIDPTLCVGSFSCINACPEGEIIGIVDGVAQLVEAAHCIGHARCAVECPVGAIKLVFGTAERGVDLPELDESFETNRPGVYIIGELGGMGLIRNAFRQGLYLGEILKKRLRASAGAEGVTDVVIVGGGPAGIAAAVACRAQGLTARIFEQDTIGGAITHYPRGKLVMGEQIVLPNYGAFGRSTLNKEELLTELEVLIKANDLRIEQGQKVVRIEGSAPSLVVTTERGTQARCRAVALAIGLRGTPRKLGVPGEDQQKVVYRLIDPEQYHERSVLVVGGGDSAVEAACQLAEESTARVSISYRKGAFTNCRPKNRERIEQLIMDGEIRAYMNTQVTRIEPTHVLLGPADDGEEHSGPATHANIAAEVSGPGSAISASRRARALDDLPSNPSMSPRRGAATSSGPHARTRGQETRLPNDNVIVCAGGELPTAFLKSVGVDTRRYMGEERTGSTGKVRVTKAELEERSRLRLTAVLTAIGISIIAGLAFVGREYYWLPLEERVQSPLHELLKPAGLWGHGVGLVATTFMMANFLYALRKRWRRMKGKASIRTWLSLHMFVGVMSPLVIAFHAAFLVNNLLALWTWAALAVVVGTGIFGRFLFSLFPAQAGRMLAMAEVREQMATAERMMKKEFQKTSNVQEVTRIFDLSSMAPGATSLLDAVVQRSGNQAKLSAELEQARQYFVDAATFERVKETAAKVAWARTQSRFYASMTRIFRLWLVLHVVIAIFMVVLVGLHVAVTTYLGLGSLAGGGS